MRRCARERLSAQRQMVSFSGILGGTRHATLAGGWRGARPLGQVDFQVRKVRKKGVTRGESPFRSRSGRERNVGGSIWLSIFRRGGPVAGSGEGANRAVYAGPKVITREYQCQWFPGRLQGIPT